MKSFIFNKIKNNIMDSFMKEKGKHTKSIIRNHMIWAMGAGVIIPLPFIDSLGVAAIQLDMIRQMCKVYDVEFKETQFKAIVTTLTSSLLARAGAKSLIKLIPGAGTYIGAATIGIMSGASTYAMGQVFKTHFERGGTLLDIDLDRMKRQFDEQFEKGKQVAKEWKREDKGWKGEEAEVAHTVEPNEPSLSDRLRAIAQLKEDGIITEEEFVEMKRKAIEKYG